MSIHASPARTPGLRAIAIAALVLIAPAGDSKAAFTSAAPVIEAIADQASRETEAVSLPVVASDTDGDALTYAAAGLPPGLSIDAATGVITGAAMANSRGVYQVTVSAGDGSADASVSFEWTVLPLLPSVWASQVSGTAKHLRDIDFIDALQGWAVGDGAGGGEVGQVRKTVDGGQTWTHVFSVGNSDLRGVDFVDAQHGWIAGGFGKVYATTDGGTTWTQQALPSGAEFNAVHDVAFADTQHGWAVGNGPGLYGTANGGQTWTSLPAGMGEDCLSVDAVSADVAWVSCYSGFLLGTTDGGATWTAHRPFGANSTATLLSVDFIDAQHGWVLSQTEGLRKTTDGGATWIAQQHFGPSFGYKVIFPDALHGWVIGFNGSYPNFRGVITATADGGSTWTTQIPSSAGFKGVYNGSFVDARHGWAVGYDGTILGYAPDTGTRSLAVSKLGTGTGTVTSAPAGIDCGPICVAEFPSGSTVTLSATATGNSVFAGWSGACSGMGSCTVTLDEGLSVKATFSPTHLVTVSKTGDGQGTVTSPAGLDCGATCSVTVVDGTLVTMTAVADAGSWFTGWSGACNTAAATCTIQANAATSATADFAAGSPPDPFPYEPGVWTVQSSGTAKHLRGIDFIDPLRGWAVGDGEGNGEVGQVRKTVDGGQTWTHLYSIGNADLRAVDFVDEQHGWIGGGFGKVFATSDGGVTWTQQALPFNAEFHAVWDVAFADPQHGWVVGNSGTFYRTADGGATWTAQYGGTSGDCFKLAVVSATTAWAACSSGIATVTTNGGATWTPRFPLGQNSTAAFLSVFFLDDQQGWALSQFAGLLKTTDGGLTWVAQYPNGPQWSYDVVFTDAQHGWVFGFNGVYPNYTGVISATADGGATWTTQVPAAEGHDGVFAAAFADGNHGWAVGFNGTVLAYVPVNHPPAFAAPAAVALSEDAADLVIPLAGLFSDPDGDALAFGIIGAPDPALAVATLDSPSGPLRINAAADAFGLAAVALRAQDPDGEAAEGLVEISIAAVNDPPTLDPIADVSVTSGQPVAVPLTGLSAGPPNEAAQALAVAAVAAAPAVAGAISVQNGAIEFTPPSRATDATTTITVTVTDDGGGTDALVRTFTLTSLSSGNTQPGQDVSVPAAPPSPGPSLVTVTFSAVTAPGETGYSIVGGLDAPAGFAFGSPATIVDVTTTAQYGAPLLVCLSFSGQAFERPETIRLFHFEQGAWVDRTVSVDWQAEVACASVSSLSPFAVAEELDHTPPVITASVTGPAGANGWFTGPVQVSWTVTDPESPPAATGCEAVMLSSDTTGITVTCEATSDGGTVSASETVKIDQAAPEIATPADISAATTNAGGMSVAFADASATDATSGVDGAVTCAPASGSTFPIGATTVTCRAADAAGHSGSASFTVTVTLLDSTPPVIVPTVTGLPGSNGWYRGDVAVDWSVTDGESAIQSTTGCASVMVTADTPGQVFTCSATSEGGAASQSVTVARDATPPSLTAPANVSAAATSAAGAVVAYPEPSAADTTSGLASPPACVPASGSQFPVGVTTVTCGAADNAGNAAAASFTVSVAAFDDRQPGRMHGEGRVTAGTHTVEFDFSVLESRRGRESGRVRIAVKLGRRGRHEDARFESRTVEAVRFTDAPQYAPGKPAKVVVDTVTFSGTGKWDRRDGYRYVVTASDRGEPGRGRDTFTIEVRAPDGQVVFSGGGAISSGNVQSNRKTGNERR